MKHGKRTFSEIGQKEKSERKGRKFFFRLRRSHVAVVCDYCIHKRCCNRDPTRSLVGSR